jgi:Coenzyme PQQ synthesis protein D (PqqD)
MRPVARTAGLVVKAVGDEVLVYDLEHHRAHSLNRAAAAMWRACDGTRAEGEIAAHLRDAEALLVTPELVRYGIGELERARLVLGSGHRGGLTRRDLIRRLGTGAIAVPLVTSIVAPTAAHAQSSTCVPAGGQCGGRGDCCPALPGLSVICSDPGGICTTCVPLGGQCGGISDCCPDRGLRCADPGGICCGGVDAFCTSNADCCTSEGITCQAGTCQEH